MIAHSIFANKSLDEVLSTVKRPLTSPWMLAPAAAISVLAPAAAINVLAPAQQ